ncbi:carbohydrate-binding protein [Chryseobacterium sp. IHB B 17019]|uniref:glycoside hydrolase family 43 protein n=1 Tax=Chryseobacterium sp. IHB B 17019 TaxID=1721091 RepID=UPI00071F8601|nr:glycoside hydrolase family 43 protein [Chryseobacterium sp. IHB B 17019]ALR29595.1 carbohydrate-binding protein [Chryseobacterium sp. IHB B 17019]
MKNNTIKLIISSLLMGCAGIVTAQNPIIQTAYTADPAPMVYNDRLYVYTTHDEDDSTWFTMNNWKVFSTNDMVNWTDHGVILSYNDFDWAKRDAWAAQCIERNGKFFMYVPMISKTNNKGAIGVAVADSPFGPFHDPLGKPLVQSEWGDIDPTVFIDDDGQAHMYWGNPKLKYVKLNENMISYSGDIVEVPMTEEAFGKREGNPERPTKYEEGPWLYKRKNLYYLFWPGGPLPEFIGYSTSKSAQGPWKYGGIIMPAEGKSFTNHPGVIDFRGKTYFFYHNGALPGGSGFTRSVSVQELNFNKDGSISSFKMTNGIMKAIAAINPYSFNQAEMIAWSENVKSYQNKTAGVFIKAKKNGAYSSVKNVDFGKDGATTFSARVGTTHNSGVTMDVRLDSLDGPIAATVKVPLTGGDDRFETVTVNVSNKIAGLHNLYFVFNGKAEKDIMFLDYWLFSK